MRDTAGWAASSCWASRGPCSWRSRPGLLHGEPPVRLTGPAGARRAAILPLLVLADLLSAHWVDVPTVDPSYWTVPPASAQRLKDSPGFIRVFGIGDKASGEPGYASETVDFPAVRDPLDWSLPLAWHLNAAKGNTPMISSRVADFTNEKLGKKLGRMRFDLEGDSHIVTGRRRAGDFPGLRRTRASAPRSSTAIAMRCLALGSWVSRSTPTTSLRPSRPWNGRARPPRPACGRRSHVARWLPMPSSAARPGSS